MAPASMAMADWANFGGAANFVDLNPTSGPRRDAAGSRIGIITASNFPGTAGTYPYSGTPGTVDVNYFRVTPDPLTCETDAPTTTATLDPAAPATGDTYTTGVKVNLSASDGAAGAAGVDTTEYRITTNGTAGDWKTLDQHGRRQPVRELGDGLQQRHAPRRVPLDGQGGQHGGDEVGHLQDPAARSATARTSSTARTILPRWIRHTRNGGTPTTGPLAPTVSGGQLHLPTNDFEIDAADATTSVGPINFLGQDLPALGTNWTGGDAVHRPQYTGGWQNVGLVVWNGDNNFFRSTLTHSLSAGSIFVEQSKDNPSTTEGARVTAAATATSSPTNTGPVTIKMRYTRAPARNSVTAQYQVVAPAAAATADWVNFPAHRPAVLDLNPSSGARRDAAGSRIGIIAQDNWPGRAGTFPSNGTPAVAHVDYFRVTPDVCPDGADSTAPTTTATTAPAAPNGSNGWFTSDVNVTLAGTDNAGGSGIDKTEYRVDGGAFATYSAPIAVTTAGTHTVEYRSSDKNGNVEATKTLTVKVDKVAPATTATLAPAAPGAGGTYTVPVTLTLAATDATSGVAKSEYMVNTAGAFGAFGAPKLAAAAAAEWVDVRRGQQADVHGAGHVLDRLPLDGRGGQRGDGQDGHVHDRRAAEHGQDRPGHHRDARSGGARSGPDVLGAGHGEVLGDRSEPGRSGGQDGRRQRVGRQVDSGHRGAEQRRHGALELPVGDGRVPARRVGLAPGRQPEPDRWDADAGHLGHRVPGRSVRSASSSRPTVRGRSCARSTRCGTARAGRAWSARSTSRPPRRATRRRAWTYTRVPREDRHGPG